MGAKLWSTKRGLSFTRDEATLMKEQLQGQLPQTDETEAAHIAAEAE